MKIERKIFEAEVKEADEKDLTVVHFISSETRDRGGDKLYAGKNDKGKGMIMQGKPVVLFMHGWGASGMEPIAKPLWIKTGEFKNRRGIQAKTQFFPDELGKRLWKKTSEAYIPNWSVGWRPLIQEELSDKSGQVTRHVYEWELLEYSLVAVPMQPDAQTMGEDGKRLNQISFKVMPERENCDLCGKKDVELKGYEETTMMLCNACIKEMEDEEKKCGELIAWRKTVNDPWEEKPYPNEHACRITDPGKYIRIRRQNDKFGKGIHAIWGIQGGGKPVELQAIRFSKDKFTPKEARAWLKDHEYKCKMFEPASAKCEMCGADMVWKTLIEDPEDGVYSCEVCKGISDEEMKKRTRCKCDKCGHTVEWTNNCDGMKCSKCDGKMKTVKKEIDPADNKAIRSDQAESLKFKVVDGDKVRSDKNVDFTMGGHHYVYDFIPEDEIWIDQNMDEQDTIATKAHEYIERLLMKYLDWKYNDAHEIASKPERLLRHIMEMESDDDWGNGDGEGDGDNQDGGDEFDSLITTHLLRVESIRKRINETRKQKGFKPLKPRASEEDKTVKAFLDFVQLFQKRLEPLELMISDLLKRLPDLPGPVDKKEKEPDICGDPPVHFIIKCEKCQKVISQCPCSIESKTERLEICDDCKAKQQPRSVVIVNTDEQRRAMLAEASKQISAQLTEALKVIPVVVKQEIDRLKGKVN
jgi:hypothetical protein